MVNARNSLLMSAALVISACGADATAPQATTGDVAAQSPDLSVADLGNSPADPGQNNELGKQDTNTVDDGDFGNPCQNNDECDSGFCVKHMGDKVCSKACVDECPTGWGCEQVGGSGSDLTYACVSNDPTLCRPCTNSSDCGSPSGAKDVCVNYETGGSFCGGACGAGATCPDGYSCTAVETSDGLVVQQCFPQTGVCACSGESIEQALSTPCSNENEYGTCVGKRACTPEGLTLCDAAVPSAESCNGMDDDCNGTIDDLSCDDENDCTEDACDPETGCVHTPLENGACDDGSNCTLADHCEQGECKGTLIDCDDSNVCTSDACDPSGGCSYSFNNSSCDDNEPCTVNDSCKLGACQGVEVSCDCNQDTDCLSFEDETVCNGTLFCDKSAFPYRCEVNPVTIVSCAKPTGEDSACLKSSCNPKSGECGTAADNEGALCDDGDICTSNAHCADGQCGNGKTVLCNDDNPCTDDSCMAGAGCLYIPNQAACEDGNPCTLGDTCASSACQAGDPMSCNDGNPCTDDPCNPEIGCVYSANNATCDDENACTSGDHCSAGSCKALEMLNCNDGDPCTDDSCNLGLGCQHKDNIALCDDDNPCTAGDICNQGQCKGVVSVSCDDGNGCTIDKCDPFDGCVHENGGGGCDDGDICTQNEQCADGQCKGGSTLQCDDGNGCTDDSCDSKVGCVGTPNSNACDDGNSCTTTDLCSEGECVGSGTLKCDDSNPCTTDICTADGCKHENLDIPCSDGDSCTVDDSCVAGKCTAGADKNCGDNNPCTDDSCNADGSCAHTANEASCDDGNLCTTGDTCENSQCVFSGLKDCNDGKVCTTDSCSPKSGCVSANNTAPCNDNNVCTTNDQCEDGACVSTTALQCDDGNGCTDDSCSAESGCSFLVNNAPCEDGEACTSGDTCSGGLCKAGAPTVCNDGNICTDDSCLAGQGCIAVNNAAACDDGDPCSASNVCADGGCGGGNTVICSDNNLCTDDSCVANQGCQFVANSASCDDGNACTAPDTCVEGKCESGPDLGCGDNNACTVDSCDGAGGCVNTGMPNLSSCGVDKHCINGQCVDECVGPISSKSFSVTQTIQQFVVSDCVFSLTMEAFGAQGGKNVPCAQQGGNGARMKGTFAVLPGELISIIVGQRGKDLGSNTGNESGTGGGGSFLFRSSGQEILIAAGGGGGGAICTSGGSASFAAGRDGVVAECGTNDTTNQGLGGCNGADGTGDAKGKGWNNVINSPTGYGSGASQGGYGGGGTVGSSHGGGGGGGFSGGGGWHYTGNPAPAGGGGGSINKGTQQSNSAGVQTGDGKVLFSW